MAALPANTLLDPDDVQDASSAAGLDAVSEPLEQRATHAIDLALARSAGTYGTTGNLPDVDTRRTFVSNEYEPGGDSFAEVVSLPAQHERWRSGATLHPLQEWEGYVIEIGNKDFTARLLDLTAGSSFEEEEATIPFSEIADEDVRTMQEGSVFRWVIGYERYPAGTKKRVSQIVFRDLPTVTASDLRKARSRAREMMRVLNP